MIDTLSLAVRAASREQWPNINLPHDVDIVWRWGAAGYTFSVRKEVINPPR